VPVVTASSVSGEGVGAARIALRALRDVVVADWLEATRGPLRLSVDRAFAVKGRGAVVTGSLRGGSLERGAALRREPGGDEVRVREIQVHNLPRERHDGGRTALNLAGLPVEALRRGDVLTSGPGIVATDRLLVSLRYAASLNAASLGGASPRAPRAGARLRLHVGTDQVDATMRRVAAAPDVAILTLDRATATFAGDRAVLREPASGAVAAGVRVLDPQPVRGVSRRRLTAERLDRLAAAVKVADAGAIHAAALDLHGAMGPGPVFAFAEDVRAALETAAVDAVAAHHREAPLSAGLPLPRARAALLRRLRSIATVERRDADLAQAAVAALLDDLVERGTLARTGEALRDPARSGERPVELIAAMDRLEAALAVAAPPPLDDAAAKAGCPPEGVRALAAEGRIVRLGPELAWATPTYHRLASLALDGARDGPLTPAAYRDATGTSRKFVMAILEDLDRRGILQRTPEGHVPGPRAPRGDTS
jgi:selenocysteine-specific elongation factor